MIHITDDISINEEKELSWVFVRSSGPGGQNVNKVATAVQLRFNVVHAEHLSKEVKERLMRSEGKRINTEGELVINARRFRTQDRNRKDALERLADIIRTASRVPGKRIKTKPTLSSKIKRAKLKQQRKRVKELRRHVVTVQE
ncbi:MAG TPA: alternative ribosome rescue aminoacyl-tRNA hydrolase ArfB [Deltaproteobacteria bacterium]|nr:alternative ribosome rescue aminoacyl-tRNA hydrolase ArfB [Deltaproteobacteria bacterium]